MNRIEQLRHFARHKYAWPGGYPLFAITRDGGILSHRAVIENYRLIRRETGADGDAQWCIEAVAINWEQSDLYCDHTGERIESAYCEDDQEGAA